MKTYQIFFVITLLALSAVGAGIQYKGSILGPSSNGNEYWVYGTNYGGPVPMQPLSAQYPGDALQAVLNLMVTNGNVYPGSQLSNPFKGTTNLLNGRLHVYSFNDANNQQGFYYTPRGFVYSNQWIVGQFELEGDGMFSTYLVGDSNAFSFATTSSGGQTYFSIKDIACCFSNSWAKSVCVNAQGIAPGIIDQCAVDWMADLVFSNYLGIGSASWSDKNNTPLNGGLNGSNAAMVGMVINGGTGHVTVQNCLFADVACGVATTGEHIRLFNNEFLLFGMFNNSPTNGWSTNDLSYLPAEYGGPIAGLRGCDLALGPAMVIGIGPTAGQDNSGGDSGLVEDKTLGGGIGVLVKNGNYFYGIPKLMDCHFEAVGQGEGINPPTLPKDVVIDNDTNVFVHNVQNIVVSEFNCSDQQTTDGGIVNWQFNGTNFLLTTNFPQLVGFGTNYAIDMGVYLNVAGGYPQMMVKSNNVVRQAF